MTTLVVLWLYMATPWALGPVPMGSGWYAVAVLDSMGACREATLRVSGAICLLAGADPPGPVAEMER